jgi:hypothetical protein
MMQNQPFNRPSKNWRLFLYPFLLGANLSLIYSFYKLFIEGNPTKLVKIEGIASLFCSFAAFYLIAGYRYLTRATPIKNQLYQLIKSGKEPIHNQFNRLFIQEEVLQSEKIEPNPYRKLMQRDLIEVMRAGKGE